MKYRSMRGKEIDLGQYVAQNEHVRALGNARMNARGDKLDARGNVIKTREEISAAYYRASPKAVKQVSLKDMSAEVFTPAQALAKLKEEAEARNAAAIQQATAPTEVAEPKRKIKDAD